MTSNCEKPVLALGPMLFHWQGADWRDFYFRLADEAPVDEVYLGETVCSKRQPFIEPHIAEVAERLQGSGKRVILSSLTLVTLERERRSVRELAAQDDLLVEANDLSALQALAGRPHAVGPMINVYNGPTAALLARQGATVICLPPELPASSIAQIARSAPGPAYEVLAFGRVPLAISARCAHARAKGLAKDNCQFVCSQDPDGLAVSTLKGQPFLAMNGVQTVSFTCQALLGELSTLAAGGVSRFRLSPQRCDMAAVARLYRDVLDGALDPAEASDRLRALVPDLPLSNGFLHGAPGAEWIADGRRRLAAHE